MKKKKKEKTFQWRNIIVFSKPHVGFEMYVLYSIVLKEYTLRKIFFKSKSLEENLKQLINIHQMHKKKRCNLDTSNVQVLMVQFHTLNIGKTDSDSKGLFPPPNKCTCSRVAGMG